MSWILLVTLLFFIPELWLGNILYDGKVLAEIVKGVAKTLIWYCIWSSYFKKSKRVLAYYGKNAEKIFSK
jgi:uncharacterized protein YqhQ